jgi:hypothetical protein
MILLINTFIPYQKLFRLECTKGMWEQGKNNKAAWKNWEKTEYSRPHQRLSYKKKYL